MRAAALFCSLLSLGLTAQDARWLRRGELSFRYDTSIAYHKGTESLVLFGGWNGSLRLQDTWIWSGNEWISRDENLAVKPPPRSAAASAYDPRSDRVLLFGGDCGLNCATADTWLWDGTRWQDATGSVFPPPRQSHAMATEGNLQGVLLFGGYDPRSGEALGDTWTYSGGNWFKILPDNPPTPRIDARMAWDPESRRVVMFGGWDESSWLAETWEYAENQWVRREPPQSPPPRSGHSMSWSPRGRITIYGGLGPEGLLNDLWEWDGVTWRELDASGDPGLRDSQDMDYDQRRDRLVMFAGWLGFSSSLPQNTWELISLAPSFVSSYGGSCDTSLGPLTLKEQNFEKPWPGESFAMRINKVPFGAPAVGLLGSSRDLLGTTPLPLDLSPLGMPGCALLVAPNRSVPLDSPGTAANWSLEVPLDPSLNGLEFYMQAAVLDPGANAFGVVLSNGLAARVGWRE